MMFHFKQTVRVKGEVIGAGKSPIGTIAATDARNKADILDGDRLYSVLIKTPTGDRIIELMGEHLEAYVEPVGKNKSKK
jgi:hypothetical protein